jgi:hypothetical protein
MEPLYKDYVLQRRADRKSYRDMGKIFSPCFPPPSSPFAKAKWDMGKELLPPLLFCKSYQNMGKKGLLSLLS